MTPEERKIYYKEYYLKNKSKLCDKLNRKVTCDKCGKCVSYSWLSKHQKSKICDKFSKLQFVEKTI